ncbi:MAG TPA: general stress protein [Pseudonocardiaceae bacterium]
MTVTSSFSGGASRPGVPRLPTRPSGWPVGSYETYEQAQRAVDFLAENNFPLPDITIVGVDLMLVERVTGKLSWRRVVSAGVGTGAWLGFIVGLLLSLLNGQAGSLAPIAVGIGGGIVFGLIFASVGYASSRGRRDFQSASQLVAGRYDVLCQRQTAEKARDLIAKFSMRPQANPS